MPRNPHAKPSRALDQLRAGVAGTLFSKREIAAIRRDPRTSRVIAAEYGVSHSTIQRIKRGERWRDAAAAGSKGVA